MQQDPRSLTPAMEDYLRAIFDLSQVETPVHTTSLARHLEVAPASATGMLKRLAARGMVDHERYAGAELTPAGEEVAVSVVRHHRIIETYLAEALGVGWDQVHPEAHRLEHSVSTDLRERMAAQLGQPDRCPHGSPIPPRHGSFRPPHLDDLAHAEAYSRVVVREVLDDSGEALRRLSAFGLVPDAELEVIASPAEGPITIHTGGADTVVDRELAAAVFVEPVD
jgi:DtxR family Mn-dependent transcriptional regulator